MTHFTRTFSIIFILAITASSLFSQNPIQVNFGHDGQTATVANWNRFTTFNVAGYAMGNLVDNQGTTTSISLVSVSSWDGAEDFGYSSGTFLPDGSAMPGEVSDNYFYDNTARTMRFEGLDNSKTYKVEIFGSRNATGVRDVQFTVGGQSTTINVKLNKDQWALFDNVSPSNGSIEFTLTPLTDWINLNAVILTPSSGGTPPTYYNVTTAISPANGSNEQITPPAGSFVQGSQLTFTAPAAASGYEFSRWEENGAFLVSTSSYSFILNGNRNLTAIYTALTYNAPSASIQGITGNLETEAIVQGAYTFQDADGHQDASTFQWYRSPNADGSAAIAISGADRQSYAIDLNDIGHYLVFEVTPKDASAQNNTGTAVRGVSNAMVTQGSGGTSAWSKDASGNLSYADGNVSIGNATPRGKLDVQGGNIWLVDNGSSSMNDILMPGHVYLIPRTNGISYLQARRYDNSGSAELQFRTYNNGSHVEALRIAPNGNVGIGTQTPEERLVVNGKIRATGIDIVAGVNINMPASDYVFEEDYDLMEIQEVEAFVKENKHLPEVPSAAEFQENGYNLGEMDDLLLRKVEELTLYIIELKKENDSLKERVEQLEGQQ